MDPKYLLLQLFEKVAHFRKAEKAYYECREVYNHPLKLAHQQEVQRRRQDLDKLMIKLPIAMPELNGILRTVQA